MSKAAFEVSPTAPAHCPAIKKNLLKEWHG